MQIFCAFMADGALLGSLGVPPPLLLQSAFEPHHEALALRFALQSLTLTGLLQQRLQQQVRLPKRQTGLSAFLPAKLGYGDGNDNVRNNTHTPSLIKGLTVRTLAIALLFGGAIGFVRALMSALPPDFSQRWHHFFEEHHSNQSQAGHEKKMGSVIYDVHGAVIATVDAMHNECMPPPRGHNARPSDIPAFMWQAVVACEDRRFFEHHGIDPRGVSRAALSLTSNGGGSTITQQLAKNLFLRSERKWTRKLMEIFLALLLENRMSKWDILHTYLSKIYWGHGIYGIEAAADFYFGKHPSLLTLGECAMLAGIIPAPELLSPLRDPSRGKKAQARALRRMVEAGFLDTYYAEATVNEPLELSTGGQDGKQRPCRAPFFVDEVLYELKKKYGCRRVFEGGLQVYTTLDLGKQELAEKIIQEAVIRYDNQRVILAEMDIQHVHEKIKELQKARNIAIKKATSRIYSEQGLDQVTALKLVEQAVARIENKLSAREHALQFSLDNFQRELKVAMGARLEAAMIALDPSSGAVRVLLGGRNYFESSFNRSTQAYRSSGSTFKPVVYLTALAEGIDRKDMLVDEAYTLGDFFPKNFDEKFREKVMVEESLLKSSNVPIVKLCAKVGVNKVCKMGKLLGIEAPLPCDLTLAVGGFKVTPLQVATVYSTIAAGGICRKPHLITRVKTQEGELLEEHPIAQENRVVDEHAVLELRKLLQAVVQRGTGQNARIGRPCAGKTGTSDGHRDAWFAGLTPDLTCVVWLGYDDNSRVGGLHPGTGGSHAAPVWKLFMKSVYKEQPIKTFEDQMVYINGMKFSHKSFKMSRNRLKFRNQVVRRKEHSTVGRTTWKDVWDWENASSVWEEREKMVEWTEKHLKRAAEIKALKSTWLQKKP